MSVVVLATDNSAFEDQVHAALGGVNGHVRWWSSDLATGSDLDGVVSGMTECDPQVVSIGPGVDPAIALDVATLIDKSRPEISVVLVAAPSPKLLEQALRAGVRDVVSPEADQHELQQVFTRATGTAERRRANLIGEVRAATPATHQGRIVSVLAPKGGSGKTALTVNVAVMLAERYPGKVAIVDLDLLFGDVTNALLLNPEHSIGDAIGTRELDPTMLKVLLTRYGRDLYVLTAPESPARGELVTDDLVAQAIDGLAAQFDYVLIDTAAGLSEVTLAAIERSDDLIFICDMSVAAVRGLTKVTAALGQLNMLDRRKHFVLNRADSKVGITLADVEAAVAMRVNVRIPSSRLVPRSMNEGTPLTTSSPKTPVARAFTDVVDLLAPNGASPAAAPKSRRRRS